MTGVYERKNCCTHLWGRNKAPSGIEPEKTPTDRSRCQRIAAGAFAQNETLPFGSILPRGADADNGHVMRAAVSVSVLRKRAAVPPLFPVCIHILPRQRRKITEKKLRTCHRPQLFCRISRSRISAVKCSGATARTIGPKESTRITISVSSSLSYVTVRR